MHLLAFSIQQVDTWIEAGGYAVLFGLLFACGLGLPLPEDIPLMVAGALIAKGQMHLLPAAIAGWCGIMSGDMMLYHFGKKFGLEITRVRFIGKHLTKERIQRVEQMFEEYGGFVVAVGRLFAGVRGAMVVAAGAIRYNLIKFLIADGLAAIVSGGFFIIVGHWLGSRLDEQHIKEFKHVFLIGALVVMLGVLAWVFLRRKRAEERMEKVTARVESAVGKVAQVTHIGSAKNPSRQEAVGDFPPLTNLAAGPNVAEEESSKLHPNLEGGQLMALEVKPLAYPSDALEPSIDKMTMEIHHGKHYATYVSNYNKALEQAPQLVGKPLHEVLANNLAGVPEAIKTAVRNNGGGAHNHALFWEIMGPRAGGKPSGTIAKAIDSTFGSFDGFKEKFKAAALGRFGSGWSWLIKRGDKFEIISTANQDSPIMEGAFPVLGLDVWEHAYYLKYQNRRAEYIDAWWNVVNWHAIDERVNRAK